MQYFLDKREIWTHKGVWYKSSEIAIDSHPECDLTPAGVLSRIRKGMTLTEASVKVIPFLIRLKTPAGVRSHSG